MSAPQPAATEPTPVRRRGLHYRLYDWVLHWSAHRHATWALALLSAAEASCFPVPPDVLLMAMALAKPPRAFRYAALATISSVIGGLIGYFIGWSLWIQIGPWCFDHFAALGFTQPNFELVRTAYQDNAFVALFTAGFTPIPYKVFTIAAGVFDVSIPIFIAASLVGRASRFFLVAALLRWIGPSIKPFLEKYLGLLTLLFGALVVLGFLALKYLGGH